MHVKKKKITNQTYNDMILLSDEMEVYTKDVRPQ